MKHKHGLSKMAIPTANAGPGISFHMLIKPGDGAMDYVALVFGLSDIVSLVGINHQLRLHPQGFQAMPELA
jgi:hypothetical protein